MKEELKNILLMGLGTMSLTTDKAKELKEELLDKGEKIYNEGLIKNEELKHNIEKKIKENITINVEKKATSQEDIIKILKNMSPEEKKRNIKYPKRRREK